MFNNKSKVKFTLALAASTVVLMPAFILSSFSSLVDASSFNNKPKTLKIMSVSPSGNLPENTTNTTLKVKTNLSAICKYHVFSDFDFANAIEMQSSKDGLTHTAVVTRLQYGHTYNYYVKCNPNKDKKPNVSSMIQFQVGNPVALKASFKMSSNVINVTDTVTLDASTSTTDSRAKIESYKWYFSDRSTGQQTAIATKQFAFSGNVKITLEVRDSFGRLAVTSQDITVNPVSGEAVLSNGSPSGILPADTTQTAMTLKTNVFSTCKYSTDANFDYATTGTAFSASGVTNHYALVKNLVNGNTYNFYVKCRRQEGGIINANSYLISFSVAN